MNFLLDTTIQIDRFLGSRERKRVINEILENNKLFSSTYVLGEYYNLINDFLTLYALFVRDKNIGETGKHITERTFGRSQARIQKLYANIIEKCDYDVELITNTLDIFLIQIEDAFTYKLEKPLLDCTECARAKQEICHDDEIPVMKMVSCRKDNDICSICQFWGQRKETLNQLLGVELDEKFEKVLLAGKEQEKELKGNNCKSIGDVIICLETMELEKEAAVCSTNKKDFKPICDCLGIELRSPDYSSKKV